MLANKATIVLMSSNQKNLLVKQFHSLRNHFIHMAVNLGLGKDTVQVGYDKYMPLSYTVFQPLMGGNRKPSL